MMTLFGEALAGKRLRHALVVEVPDAGLCAGEWIVHVFDGHDTTVDDIMIEGKLPWLGLGCCCSHCTAASRADSVSVLVVLVSPFVLLTTAIVGSM